MNIVDLAILKKMVSGGGGSGTDNYNDLLNLPQINGETLAGNKTAENLGLQDALTFDSSPTEDSTNPVESGGVFNALAGKQDNLTFDGAYDASTNKAATESTVTNAISELDVSETSFDADETIDTISETDGKIAVTKKDIAIASNQVTSMTGYTKPSSAPANPAIQTSDTANQAFGKLEFKTDTNQTNILYTLDKTGKNIFDLCNESNYTPSSVSGLTATLLPDGTISVTGTPTTTEHITFRFIEKSGSHLRKFNGYYLSSGVIPSGSVIKTEAMFALAASPYTRIGTSYDGYLSEALEFPDTSGLIYFLIRIYCNSTTTAINLTFKPMICTKADYDISPAYVPYALPNTVLTQLEAEDRAALAEVVDSGAKNIFNIFTAAEVKAETITRTINADGTVTVSNSGTNIYTATLTCRISLVANTQYVISGCPSGGSDNTYSLSIRTTSAQPISDAIDYGSGSGVFTVPTSGEYVVYLRVAPNYAFSDKIFKPMVCTQAEWKISRKFVPYRPSYDELSKSVYTVQTANFACSAADTYEYTGLYVTVPAGHIYEIAAYDNYGNSVPVGIAIADSNVDITTTTTMMAESTGKTSADTDFTCRSVMCITNLKGSNKTYYLFVKHNNIGSNPIALMWRQII